MRNSWISQQSMQAGHHTIEARLNFNLIRLEASSHGAEAYEARCCLPWGNSKMFTNALNSWHGALVFLYLLKYHFVGNTSSQKMKTTGETVVHTEIPILSGCNHQTFQAFPQKRGKSYIFNRNQFSFINCFLSLCFVAKHALTNKLKIKIFKPFWTKQSKINYNHILDFYSIYNLHLSRVNRQGNKPPVLF